MLNIFFFFLNTYIATLSVVVKYEASSFIWQVLYGILISVWFALTIWFNIDSKSCGEHDSGIHIPMVTDFLKKKNISKFIAPSIGKWLGK